jgi:hypothetical protein
MVYVVTEIDNMRFTYYHIPTSALIISFIIYRKPTEMGTVIHLTSNHPYEQKISASTYYINRLITLPITDKAKQNEWETILAIA